MPQAKPFNLFVYGTLMNPTVFRAVLGRRMVLHASDADSEETALVRDAVLEGFKKISPDRTYLYAVPDPSGKIRGYFVGPLPPACMNSLRKYEGRNYLRRTVRVQTREGTHKAIVFVANLEQLEHAFGHAFHDPFKQEILLRQKIEEALLEAQREQLHTDASDAVARRALGELHGDTIRDLVRLHFDSGGISDYAIRHSIKDTPVRDFSRIADDPEAAALAPNYLALAVRQVIFNQIEEQVRSDLRYELDQLQSGGRFYDRTLSCLAVLGLLNASADAMRLLVRQCLWRLDFRRNHLIDYVKWAVTAADGLYDPKAARRQLAYIRAHLVRGPTPLGTELEFSNTGHNVIRDPDGRLSCEARYDGFLYFTDFGLDILTWKLGGHVDDHRDKASSRPRRGFFETALGNLSIGENISKPITADPWVLNQIIHQARTFYDVAPHSMHLSMQLPGGQTPDSDQMLPVPVMKCLLALAGDASYDDQGRLRIKRLAGEEITRTDAAPHMLFSECRKRFSKVDLSTGSSRASGHYVQQYRFLRLSAAVNYEPIVMALKGLQAALGPGNFLTAAQYQSSPRHRRAYQDLMAWSIRCDPIAAEDIDFFLRHVHEGLLVERRRRPAHSQAYISSSIDELRKMLASFNALPRTAAQKTPPVKP